MIDNVLNDSDITEEMLAKSFTRSVFKSRGRAFSQARRGQTAVSPTGASRQAPYRDRQRCERAGQGSR